MADWHALTSEYASTEEIRANSLDMVIDWLSAGLDPQRSTLFIQSSILLHAELFRASLHDHTPGLARAKPHIQGNEGGTGPERPLHLRLPWLSGPAAADIILYKAYGVPVGVDQLPHVELTREIARRFNFLYRDIFPVPEPLLTEIPKLLGIDGRKMSKSYENSIYLSDRGDALKKKVMAMFTDPQRQRKKDPGRPELCNVFTFHQLYTPGEEVEAIAADCRSAAIGCIQCKGRLAERIAKRMAPIHERQEYYRSHPSRVARSSRTATAGPSASPPPPWRKFGTNPVGF